MRLPVICVQIYIADGVSGVDHPAIAHINPHMGHRPRAVISSREKDNVPWFGFGGRSNRALIVNALRCGTGQVVNAAVGKDPADKAAAIKAGRRI